VVIIEDAMCQILEIHYVGKFLNIDKKNSYMNFNSENMNKLSNKNSRTQSEERIKQTKVVSSNNRVVNQKNDLLIVEGNIYHPNEIYESQGEGLELSQDRIGTMQSKPRPQTQSLNTKNHRDSKIVKGKFISITCCSFVTYSTY
jgi:hypothetical protein